MIVIGCSMTEAFRIENWKLVIQVHSTQTLEQILAVTCLSDQCFSTCSSLSSLIIPSLVTSLGNECLTNREFLSSVIVPNSVTSLGIECFANSESLSSVIVPNSVKFAGELCFH
jgi:hypothetical protein